MRVPKSATLRVVCGAVLAILTLASAGLAIAGIWEMLPGETAAQLFGTFVTVGGTTVAVTYIADTFFSGDK